MNPVNLQSIPDSGPTRESLLYAQSLALHIQTQFGMTSTVVKRERMAFTVYNTETDRLIYQMPEDLVQLFLVGCAASRVAHSKLALYLPTDIQDRLEIERAIVRIRVLMEHAWGISKLLTDDLMALQGAVGARRQEESSDELFLASVHPDPRIMIERMGNNF